MAASRAGLAIGSIVIADRRSSCCCAAATAVAVSATAPTAGASDAGANTPRLAVLVSEVGLAIVCGSGTTATLLTFALCCGADRRMSRGKGFSRLAN